jgi:hypothetical protein
MVTSFAPQKLAFQMQATPLDIEEKMHLWNPWTFGNKATETVCDLAY